ncbi:MAG: hypothetical protein K9K67_16175, partial [Bacteriovoracaceae bacterium]|nr:hypothetical protein [Bacteriovoracaceae bacterium]
MGFWKLLLALGFSLPILANGVAQYSEATDVFEIMDHVSRWDNSLTPIYRDAWQKKFPITLEDKNQFSMYAAIRKKFHDNSPTGQAQESDIFGDAPIGFDLFSEAFYSSKSIGEALRKLEKKGVTTTEIKFLSGFYQKYKKQLTEFVKESTHFSVKLLDLNKEWKDSALDKSTKKAIPFILGKEGQKVKVQLRPVWWPKNIPPLIDVRGPYIILRYH